MDVRYLILDNLEQLPPKFIPTKHSEISGRERERAIGRDREGKRRGRGEGGREEEKEGGKERGNKEERKEG